MPSERTGAVEGTTREMYEKWLMDLSSQDAENLARSVAFALVRPLGALSISPSNIRWSGVSGLPQVEGELRIASRREEQIIASFAATVTTAGRASNSTWVVCVAVEMRDPASTGPVGKEGQSTLRDSLAMARSFYYLNRTFSGTIRRPVGTDGPFASRDL